MFYQDKTTPHTSIVTRHIVQKLGWEVLMDLPYCPDLTPSDYHLFLLLQNFLRDKKLSSKVDYENRLVEFFLPIKTKFSIKEAP